MNPINPDEGTPVSLKIRERLAAARKRFNANDNIAEFIQPGELEKLLDEVEHKMQGVLDSLVIDTERDHNTNNTARRVAKMYLNEVFKGRYVAAPPITEFPNAEHLNELMIVGPITVRSACSHHFCPSHRADLDRGDAQRAHQCDRPVQVRPTGRLGDGAPPDPGRSRGATGRPDPGEDPARWPGHRDGGQSFLHVLARRARNGQQNDQLGDAWRVPQGLCAAPRIPLPDSSQGLTMLVRLLYASRVVDNSPAAIDAILAQSRQHNPGSGITGVLCYGGGIFLQAIEGGRSAVNELYGHI